MKPMMSLCLAAAVVLAGCAAGGVKVTDAQVSSLQVGISTEADTVARFGKPTSRTRTADGTVRLQYVYSEVQMRAASFIPIVGLLAGGTDIKTNMVLLTFGPDGKLKDTMSSSGEHGTGMGVSAGKINPGDTQQPRQ